MLPVGVASLASLTALAELASISTFRRVPSVWTVSFPGGLVLSICQSISHLNAICSLIKFDGLVAECGSQSAVVAALPGTVLESTYLASTSLGA